MSLLLLAGCGGGIAEVQEVVTDAFLACLEDGDACGPSGAGPGQGLEAWRPASLEVVAFHRLPSGPPDSLHVNLSGAEDFGCPEAPPSTDVFIGDGTLDADESFQGTACPDARWILADRSGYSDGRWPSPPPDLVAGELVTLTDGRTTLDARIGNISTPLDWALSSESVAAGGEIEIGSPERDVLDRVVDAELNCPREGCPLPVLTRVVDGAVRVSIPPGLSKGSALLTVSAEQRVAIFGCAFGSCTARRVDTLDFDVFASRTTRRGPDRQALLRPASVAFTPHSLRASRRLRLKGFSSSAFSASSSASAQLSLWAACIARAW
jgi:hypothetical protein